MNKKLTDQELEEMNLLREQYSKIMFDMGQLAYDKYQLEEQIKLVDQELTGLRSDIKTNGSRQDEFLEKIREKYGEGVLDTQTGEILIQS
jgi:hypothetical protein